jgi:hypothetical protein
MFELLKNQYGTIIAKNIFLKIFVDKIIDKRKMKFRKSLQIKNHLKLNKKRASSVME